VAIYLGSAGIVQLTRVGDGAFRSEMDPGDVNISERRFSFDFPNGTFLTGDRLSLRRIEADGTPSGQPLDFVVASGWGDGIQHPDGTWYVNVDALGGLRLYRSWSDALAGEANKAVQLQVPAGSYPFLAELEGGASHCLGQIAEFSLSTDRVTADVTGLGDAFARQWSGLISGSGEIRCFWDWRPSRCGGVDASQETAQYFHQLVLRQQLGSEFKAELIIKRDGAEPLDDALPGIASRTALFYAITAVVTNVGMAFEPGEPLQSTIQFVTTGEIALRYELPSAYLLLQEDGDKLFLEEGSGFVALEADA
jgi:hypothetical protein